ncbi:MAG: ETC complex I subunit [Hyphomonadaceae bacterium]
MLAKIHLPAKNAMQSGFGGQRRWVLEFEPGQRPPDDLLMGWTGSRDTNEQVRLFFDTKEQALEFARRHTIPHRVVEPPAASRVIKAYADNFAFRRREPWSH